MTGRITFLTDADEQIEVEQPDPIEEGGGVQVEWEQYPEEMKGADHAVIEDSWEVVASDGNATISGVIREVDHKPVEHRTYFWL